MKKGRAGELEIHGLLAGIDDVDGKQWREQGVHKSPGVPERVGHLAKEKCIGVHEEIEGKDGGNANAHVFDT